MTTFHSFPLQVPSHWLSALINGDESSFDYYDDPADRRAYRAFCENEIPAHASVSVDGDAEGYFCHSHDASGYGVKACDVVDCVVLTAWQHCTEAMRQDCIRAYDGPVSLRKVRLNTGGYDSDGCYWGVGEPLYFAQDDEGMTQETFRASCRAEAIEKARKVWVNGKFRP